MVTHPTVIVGVGEAGIQVLSTVHEVVEENDDEEKFEFIALDTDKDALNMKPPGAKEILLTLDDDFLGEHIQEYPYLLEEMNIEGSGAKRQRPIGRYKVDRTGNKGYDFIFENLDDWIQDHYSAHDTDLDPDTASFNIFLVHSFGGGTGSGSYPMLVSVLNEIADELIDNNENYYIGGVGIVPKIVFDTDVHEPPGKYSDYYPNAYAAYNDLDHFRSIDVDEQVNSNGITIWANNLNDEESTASFDQIGAPFDDYWLAGVNERKIQGDVSSTSAVESYGEELDQSIARSIHAVSKLNMSAEDWADANPHTGAFAQAEIRVPHRLVERLVDKQSEAEQKTERRTEIIPEKISSKEKKKDRLADLKSNLDTEEILEETTQEEIEADLETRRFTNSEHIIENKSPSEIQSVLDTIEDEYSLVGLIYAVETLREKIESENGAELVEEEWRGTVEKLWSKYNLQGQSEYGARGVRTIPGKVSIIEEYLQDNIETFTETTEEWNPSLMEQIQDMLPPVIGITESDREYAERWLRMMQSDRERLQSIKNEWGRVERMLEVLEDSRIDIRDKIDDQLAEIDKEITELQNERDDLKKEIRVLENEIEELKSELTTEKTNERVAILPIREDKIDEIDEATLESLTSLSKYVEDDYIDTEKYKVALNDRIDFCKSWNADIVDRKMEGTDEKPTYSDSDEMWFLYNEENSGFGEYIEGGLKNDKDSSGDRLQNLTNPYRIEYLSYTRRGPISAFTTYQRYEELEDAGRLSDYADQYDGYHRRAFGYLELYGPKTKKEFVKLKFELPLPPELNIENIDKDKEGGDLKNYVKNPGLDSYLWKGKTWKNYELQEGDNRTRFRGWKRELGKNGISWNDFQGATPDPQLKSEWLADQVDWEDLILAYSENLRENEDIQVQFVREQ